MMLFSRMNKEDSIGCSIYKARGDVRLHGFACVPNQGPAKARVTEGDFEV